MPVRADHPRRRTAIVCGALVALAGAVGLSLVSTGCGADSKDYFVVQYDAGVDAAEEAGTTEAGAEVDPTLGGPCTEDLQCDDLIPCTFDRCDQTLSRCRNTPDDTQCADNEFCNGQEKCVLRQGCVPGPVVTCQDQTPCTIDRCVEATRTCERALRDSDGDGDPDDHCEPNRDCDDTDPTVSSTRAEICGNFKDDNCNGEIDEQPCATSANDTCATALAVNGPGTFLLSSVAAQKDYVTSCTVPNPAAARDIVLAITVPPGDARDVIVRAKTQPQFSDVAIALESTCGSAASELACAALTPLSEVRTIARSIAAGTTVYAIVTTQSESNVDVTVDMPPASTKPANESCAAPKPVAIDTPFTVSLIDAAKDLASGCEGKTGELTYSFTLTEPRDVRIFASTLLGNGSPVVSLRAPDCADELRCGFGGSPPVFARNLPAGTHVFSVAGTAQIDASVVVQTSAPTPVPPNQSCATAPVLPPNTDLAVNLAGLEDAIKNGCFQGGPTAAYALELSEPSDVLLVGRFPLTDFGGVSLNHPDCTPGELLACSTGYTPQRVSRRNVPTGSYRAVIADQQGSSTQLTAFVRPTVPPTTVTSDSCQSPQVIPEATGGFFVGDTTNATADFNAGCDAPGQPFGGAKDQLLSLVLTQQRRVVFDMSGSLNTTVLTVRSGVPCPGVEVPNACNAGLTPSRSFLDLVLPAGTYWIQVDGWSGSSGSWNLDVRILPP